MELKRKEFTYKGQTVEELKKLDVREFAKHLPSRQRRNLLRQFQKIEDFVKKLKSTNIQQLIDVREIPLSRKNGFSKTILQQKLRDASIFYKHYPELGSPKRIRHQLHTDLNYELFFREYKEVVKDDEVQQKIKEVEKDSKMKKTVLLCFERDYKTCHRSIIAEELVNQGWKVNHL